MSIGVTAATATLIGGAVAGAGSIGGSLLQANSAGNAEKLQQQEANASLDFQKQQFATEQANEAPWLQAGTTALGQLSAGTGPNGSLTAAYPGGPFVAPTDITEQNDPGFQARLKLGQQALEASAAAQGTAGGGQLQAAENYGQNFASNEYGNVYARAMGTYNTNYGAFENQQANTFNRLSSIAGLGQNATAQINQAGQNTANNVTGINTNLANQNSGLITDQGSVLASGLGGATSSITNANNTYANQQLLQQILTQQSANQTGYGMNNPNSLPNGPWQQTQQSFDPAQD